MERYKTIIDNWKEFEQACEKPAVSTVRKNHVKAGEDFEELLRDSFETVEQTDWNPDVYRLDTEYPGKSFLHWHGEYYVQEESATLPVEVLSPENGDKVLDMCAAPGGKTTQIASKTRNKVHLIANDVSSSRLKSLHSNIYRTGSAAVITNYDARNIPEDEKYDKILLDAPCSGEGDKCRRNFEAAEEEERNSLSELQKQLIEKASKLLKDNGEIVYSTCTIAPEENEAVVKHALEETALELKQINSEIPHNEGVTSFQGEHFGKEMRKTVRVYPHHFDSGVIYVARLGK